MRAINRLADECLAISREMDALAPSIGRALRRKISVITVSIVAVAVLQHWLPIWEGWAGFGLRMGTVAAPALLHFLPDHCFASGQRRSAVKRHAELEQRRTSRIRTMTQLGQSLNLRLRKRLAENQGDETDSRSNLERR